MTFKDLKWDPAGIRVPVGGLVELMAGEYGGVSIQKRLWKVVADGSDEVLP